MESNAVTISRHTARKSTVVNRRKSEPATSSGLAIDEISRRQVATDALRSLETARKKREAEEKITRELTPQEIRDLKFVFDTFDSKNRGLIDSADVRRSMRVMGFKVSLEEVDEMIGDVHGRYGHDNREVTLLQFLELIIYKQADARDVHAELEQGFKLMDVGSKGYLGFDDLKMASRSAKLKFRDGVIRDMMDEADKNGDNRISKDEFFQIMMQTNLF